MTSTLDIWNTIIGVLGLLSLLCQLVFWIVQNRLPTAKLRVLEETLQETEHLLEKCIEEGRLVHQDDPAQFQCRLAELRTRTSDIRVETLGAKNYMDDVRNMMKGLSKRTGHLCEEVRATRAEISTSSSTASQRLLEDCSSCDDHSQTTTEVLVHAQSPSPIHSFPSSSLPSVEADPLGDCPLTTLPGRNLKTIDLPLIPPPGLATNIDTTAGHSSTLVAGSAPLGIQAPTVSTPEYRRRTLASSKSGKAPVKRKKQYGAVSRAHARAIARLARMPYT
ncbi:hypothetical protein C8Q78DRAFT_1080159 [Trametes maxima]|nr:hypothetical protein C8Q78DRAFT_1080159 [Trametes maxima]